MRKKKILSVALAAALFITSCPEVNAKTDEEKPPNVFERMLRHYHESKTKGVMHDKVRFAREMDKVRLKWEAVPDAVMYQVVLLKSVADTKEDIVCTCNYVYSAGVEIDLTPYGDERKNFYYKVCPQDYEGLPIAPFSAPRPITDGEFNTVAPLPLTEFDKMDFAPLYPTYTWIPFLNAEQYQIQVFRSREDGDDTLVDNLIDREHDAYEWSGYTYPDTYYWRVRALDKDGRAMSEWSEKTFFKVTAPPVTIAAFGDSITHGGGATATPPCKVMYNWITYAGLPIKNLGRSGDTTADMLERFDNDVLAFRPKILVIMGGVNDYRGGVDSSVTIDNLAAIREKCRSHGIIPVFATPTPINGWLIARRKLSHIPYFGWQHLQRDIIAWINTQPYHVDVTEAMTEPDGDLNGKLTADGLHPDYKAKKYIGETIGNYLRATFPDIVKSK